MKKYIAIIYIAFFCSVYQAFGQNTYAREWFLKHCNSCNEQIHDTNSSKDAWNNALVSFANRDYKKAKRYLLNDQQTNDTLKTLLEKHILLKLDVDDNARDYFLAVNQSKNKDFQQFANKSLALYYFEKKQFDSALVYYDKALKVKSFQTHYFKSEILESTAYIYLTKEKYMEADFLYKKVLQLYKQHQDSIQIARNYSNLGNLYFEQYKDELAGTYFDSAYNFAKPLKDFELKSMIAYNMHVIAELSKDHTKAVTYLKESSAYKDSLQKQTALWQVAQEKEAFNIAKKQAELNLKTAQRNTFIAISVAVVLLLIIGIVFYRKLMQQNREIKKLNHELNETNSVKNQLFTIIAHDLRSPVARLKQLFQLRALQKDTKAITSDKNVSKIIDSLSLLLDNLLNWSLSQSDLLSVQKEWFPLWQIVHQIELQYQALIHEKNIQFSTNIDKSTLVYGDMEIFKIVIRNCLDNAIKFTPKNGQIAITGKTKDDIFTVFITDSGIGIPEKVLKSVFEIQSNKIQKDTSGRTSSGLGLMLTKSMIQLNGGTIQIQPNPTGGTIVHISLPYKNAA